MQTTLRVALGLIGVFAFVLAAQFWIHPAQTGAPLGLSGQGVLGLATLRADLGSLFAANAILSIAAAIRNDGRLVIAPLLLIGLALLGRFVTVAVDGWTASSARPILVEAVMSIVFAASYFKLGNRR
jgi:hypothetical protein